MPDDLQCAPVLLFPFYTFKQGLEIAFSETLCALSLDDLEEQGGSVLNRFCEQLKEISFIIAVNEDTQFLERFQVLIYLTYAVKQVIIASLYGHPQPLVVESARSGLGHHVRPGLNELLDALRGR